MVHEDVLDGAGYCFEMNSLTLQVDQRDGVAGQAIVKNARVLHEFDHLVRMLGTSYGMLRYSLSSLYLHNFLECFHALDSLESLRSDWNKVKAKIPAQMTRAQLDSVYFNEQGLGSLYKAQSFRGAIRFLDGNSLTGYGIGELAAWSEVIARISGEGALNADELHEWLNRMWATRPPNTELIYIDGRPINCRDILEYLGIVVEMAFRVQYGRGDHQFPEDLSPKTYLQILNAIRHLLPNAIDTQRGLMAQEIEALLELALWIPVWPGMTKQHLPVHGVHLIPSYRLHHILEACKAINYEFSFDMGATDVLDISPRCKELQSQLCAHLGWKTPWEIAPHWISALSAYQGTQRDTWDKHYFHHPRSRRTAWSKQLLSECANDPVSGAMLAGSKHYGSIGFPAVLELANFEQGYILNKDVQWPEGDNPFRRMDLLLFTASTYAPLANDWQWLPAIVQDEALDTWRRTPLGVER